MYPIIEKKDELVQIAPKNFTNLIKIVDFLSEKNLLQDIIDSGDLSKQKNVLDEKNKALSDKLNNSSQCVQNNFKQDLINRQENSKNLSLEEQIEKNAKEEKKIKAKFLGNERTYNRSLDGLPMSNGNDSDETGGNNMYPQLRDYNSINIINETSKNKNKFDINRINYDLCCNDSVWYVPVQDGGSLFCLNSLFIWYKYFIKHQESTKIKEINWYKFFLACSEFGIRNRQHRKNIECNLIADFLIAVFENKKKLEQLPSGSETIRYSELDNITACFEEYIEYCFKNDNLPNFRSNMDTLIKFAEAILSLYVEKQETAFTTNTSIRDKLLLDTYINRLTSKLDELVKQAEKVDFSEEDYIYYKYSLSKLFLLIKNRFLQFVSTKDLDFLNNNFGKSKKKTNQSESTRTQVKNLKTNQDEIEEYSDLKLFMLHFDELEKKFLEIPIKTDGINFVEETKCKDSEGNKDNIDNKNQVRIFESAGKFSNTSSGSKKDDSKLEENIQRKRSLSVAEAEFRKKFRLMKLKKVKNARVLLICTSEYSMIMTKIKMLFRKMKKDIMIVQILTMKI